jgi:hypothetical protein
MPFEDNIRPPLDLDAIETDDDAALLLPPYPIARKTYAACRKLGAGPAVALQETLDLWRQLQACASASMTAPTSPAPR